MCCLGGAPADAQTQEDYSNTLVLMRDAYLAHEEVEAASINSDNQSIVITLRGGTEVISYPDNLHLQLRATEPAAERADILKKFVSAALHTHLNASDEGPHAPESVLPIIRPTAMTASLPKAPDLVSLPFAADLSIFFVFDAPHGMQFVSQADAAALADSPEALLVLARRNFGAFETKPVIVGQNPYFIILDGNYEASVLLDTEFWTKQDEVLGEIVVAPLARDLVFFADRSVPGQEAVVREIVDKYINEVAYPLTDILLVWRDGVWVELTE